MARAWPCVLWGLARAAAPYHILDPADFAPDLGADLAWANGSIPLLDFPDKDLRTTYYYRWRVFRKHAVRTRNDGWVVTEFLPRVGWAGKHNTIPAAAGHHIAEGQWFRDAAVIDDYITFWFERGGTPESYTNWIGWAAMRRHALVGGSAAFTERLLGDLAAAWPRYERKYLVNPKKESGARQCWWQNDGYDAMEVSISGSGCRPTIASALFGEAQAIVRLAKAAGNASAAATFARWADFSRRVVLEQHWNDATAIFAVIPDRQPAPTVPRTHCDLARVRIPDKVTSVRELLGFTPWYFSTGDAPLIPAQRAGEFAKMWAHLFDPDGFAAPWGLRTAERRHPCYNYSWDHGDCWNGPSWPYETSRVLAGLANYLVDTPAPHAVTRAQYWALLQQYARQHTRTSAVNDTAHPPGSGHVFENLHPDLGYWNNRAQMYWRGDSNRNMGDDYFHSSFVDLVLGGLVGIRAQDSGELLIAPLAEAPYFAVDGVRYRGRDLAVTFDASGRRYASGKGLCLLIDGRVVARRADLGRLRWAGHDAIFA